MSLILTAARYRAAVVGMVARERVEVSGRRATSEATEKTTKSRILKTRGFLCMWGLIFNGKDSGDNAFNADYRNKETSDDGGSTSI